jgi:hypothetical protein
MRRGVRVVCLPVAALVAAAVGVHAASAAPRHSAARASTVDLTYSCRVRRERYVDLYASVTMPPAGNVPQPGVLVLTTGVKTVVKNNTQVTVTQVGLQAARNSLKIDTSSCRRVKQQIPLSSKGLPGPALTATPSLFGHIAQQCKTTARVLVRLQFETANGIPSHALLAVRNDDAGSRPIAFYNWTPRKLSAFTARSCTTP